MHQTWGMNFKLIHDNEIILSSFFFLFFSQTKWKPNICLFLFTSCFPPLVDGEILVAVYD